MSVQRIGLATLYLADCREIMPALAGLGAILADPPYGMDYRSGHNSSRSGDGAAMVRKDGNFAPIKGDKEPFDPAPMLALNLPSILWGANYYADRLPAGAKWLIWDKLAGKTPFPSGADVEQAWTNLGGPSRLFTHLWRGIMRAGEENVSRGGKLHPNQKPVALMAWCLGMLPTTGAVLDPYMGSGTTGLACVRAGREFVGIESDPVHFANACHRLDEAQRQSSLFAAA